MAERSMVVKDLTSSSSKLTSEELMNLPIENLQDALQIQAGVTTDLGGGIHIRGGRSSEIQYYVDGIAIANPFYNGLAVPVENNAIEELEVISGTFNAEYGQAMSGIVNIVTKEGSTEFLGNLSVQVGDLFLPMTISSSASTRLTRFRSSILKVSQRPYLKDRVTFFVSGKVSLLDNWLWGTTRDSNRRILLPLPPAQPEDWYIEETGDGVLVPMNPLIVIRDRPR